MIDFMLNSDGPLTRDAYLDLAYGGELPDPWTVEHEMEVPEPLRDPKAVVVVSDDPKGLL